MKASELAAAITRAHTLCDAEVAAARDEYDETRRKIAAARKARSTAARRIRDDQVRALRDQFAAERRPAPASP